MFQQSETRVQVVLSLCSDFVEVIQHFAARPQDYNTQRDDQKGGHFLSSSWPGSGERATRQLVGR